MLLAGAGGHAQELVDILLQEGHSLEGLALFDDVNNLNVTNINGIKLISTLEEAKQWVQLNGVFALATGSPKVRKILYDKLITLESKLVSIIATTSFISKQNTEFKAGLNIMNFCMISANVTIGIGSLINAYTSVHHDAVIGSFTEIGPGCRILGGVKIGDNCFIGSGAVILPHVKIGDGSVVGAGAVVNRSVAPGDTVVGVPAKRLKL